jgi:sugar-specific transcriptional regulator TrmB
MITKETQDLLQLTPQETRVLETLEHTELNITKLAKACKFPRTTLYTALSTLTSRKLIRIRTQGKARLVSLLYPKTQTNIFSNQKKQNIISTWKEIIKNKNQRILAIQSSASLREAVENFHAKEFIPLNEDIKKNHIIIETITNRNALATYMDIYKHDSKLQKDILQSFEGRMADHTFVDNQYLHMKTDLVITHNRAYLMQWKKDVCIEIEEREIVDFLKQLFELVQGYGTKNNFNEYIKESKLRLAKT